MTLAELEKSNLDDDQKRYLDIQNELTQLNKAKKQAFENLLIRAKDIELDAIRYNSFCGHDTHQVVIHKSDKRIHVCKTCGNLKIGY